MTEDTITAKLSRGTTDFFTGDVRLDGEVRLEVTRDDAVAFVFEELISSVRGLLKPVSPDPI